MHDPMDNNKKITVSNTDAIEIGTLDRSTC